MPSDVKKRLAIDTQFEIPMEQVRTEVSRIYHEGRTRQLEEAIASLSDEYREVILLRQFEERSFAEIGERMSRSPDAARMLLTRAMAALSVAMSQLGDGRGTFPTHKRAPDLAPLGQTPESSPEASW